MPTFSAVASAVPYDDTASGIGADNLQDAIDILAGTFSGLNPMQPLYSNALGAIAVIPTRVITSDFGSYDYVPVDLNTSPNYNLYAYEDVLDSTGDNSNGHGTFFLNLHYGRGGTAFDALGNLALMNLSSSHEGSGRVGTMQGISLSASIGNGTNGDADNVRGVDVNHYVNSGSDLTNQAVGYYYVFGCADPVSAYLSAYSANMNGETTGGVDGVYFSSGMDIGQGLRAFNADLSGTVGQRAVGFSVNTSTDSEFFSGFAGNFNGSVTQDISGFDFYVQGTVGNGFNGINVGFGTGTVATYVNLLSGYFSNLASCAGSLNGLTIGIDGAIGTGLTLANLYSNSAVGSDAFGVSVSLNGTAANKTVINFNAADATGRLQGIVGFLNGSATDVVGIQIGVDGATSPNRKKVADFSGGSFSAYYEARTGNYTFNIADAINQLGGTFWIDAGHPLLGGEFIFGNNIGHQIIIEDDMGPDVLGGVIGFSMNALVGQVAVANAKTIDTINFMLTGASVPDVSGQGITDGGTISHLSCYRAIGLLPQGGNINITNMYAFRADPFLSAASPANTWGVFIEDTNAENYFGHSVNVGSATKKVSNSDVGIEIGSVKTFLNGRGTTAQKNAFAALAGMQFFDTDLAKLQWYDGFTWNDVGGTGFVAPTEIQEVPSGATDGVNTTYVLSQTPNSDACVLFFRNGNLLIQGVHYTIAGDTITTTLPLEADQVPYADYNYGGTALNEKQEVPSGATDGVNTTYVLSQTPTADASVKFFRNGVLLRQGTQYTIAGDTITTTAPLEADQVPYAHYIY